jgi:hypothetical protein
MDRQKDGIDRLPAERGVEWVGEPTCAMGSPTITNRRVVPDIGTAGAVAPVMVFRRPFMVLLGARKVDFGHARIDLEDDRHSIDFPSGTGRARSHRVRRDTAAT